MNKITHAPEDNKDRSIVRLSDIDQMMEEVDRAFQDGMLHSYTTGLARLQNLSVLGMARCMFLWNTRWKDLRKQQGTEQEFYSYMQTEFGYVKRTVDDYIDVWIAVEDTVKTHQKAELLSKGISYLAPPAKAYAQNLIDLDEEFWDKVIDCTTRGEVAQLIREAKGVEARKGTLTLKLYKDGSLAAFKNDKRYPVGFLSVEDDEPAVLSAIKRIVNSTGIEVE